MLTFSPLLRQRRWTKPSWCFCQATCVINTNSWTVGVLHSPQILSFYFPKCSSCCFEGVVCVDVDCWHKYTFSDLSWIQISHVKETGVILFRFSYRLTTSKIGQIQIVDRKEIRILFEIYLYDERLWSSRWRPVSALHKLTTFVLDFLFHHFSAWINLGIF